MTRWEEFEAAIEAAEKGDDVFAQFRACGDQGRAIDEAAGRFDLIDALGQAEAMASRYDSLARGGVANSTARQHAGRAEDDSVAGKEALVNGDAALARVKLEAAALSFAAANKALSAAGD